MTATELVEESLLPSLALEVSDALADVVVEVSPSPPSVEVGDEVEGSPSPVASGPSAVLVVEADNESPPAPSPALDSAASEPVVESKEPLPPGVLSPSPLSVGCELSAVLVVEADGEGADSPFKDSPARSAGAGAGDAEGGSIVQVLPARTVVMPSSARVIASPPWREMTVFCGSASKTAGGAGVASGAAVIVVAARRLTTAAPLTKTPNETSNKKR
jgi:hypothetical protein